LKGGNLLRELERGEVLQREQHDRCDNERVHFENASVHEDIDHDNPQAEMPQKTMLQARKARRECRERRA
jgi:hypothetical protein